MDRRILRQKAKAEYKKLVKDMPKKKRPSFQSVFPTIKQHIIKNSQVNTVSESAATVEQDDEALLDDFLVDLSDQGAIDLTDGDVDVSEPTE